MKENTMPKKQIRLVTTNPGNEGFTLIEIMLASTILALVLLAMMSVTVQSFNMVRDTDERITAINDAQAVLNSLRAANVNASQFPGNVTTAFPAGTLDPPLDNLQNEAITIQYLDAAGNVDPTANPLFVNVSVRYSGPDGRAYDNIVLSTVLADF